MLMSIAVARGARARAAAHHAGRHAPGARVRRRRRAAGNVPEYQTAQTSLNCSN